MVNRIEPSLSRMVPDRGRCDDGRYRCKVDDS
jgi:hypothetical protein